MTRILSIALLLIAASFANAQDAALRLAASIEWPKARLTYADAKIEAARQGKPLVVFVGSAARPIDGAITVSANALSDGTRSAIIVSTDGANGYWLSIMATDAQIRDKINLQTKVVRPATVDPFRFVQSASTACRT